MKHIRSHFGSRAKQLGPSTHQRVLSAHCLSSAASTMRLKWKWLLMTFVPMSTMKMISLRIATIARVTLTSRRSTILSTIWGTILRTRA